MLFFYSKKKNMEIKSINTACSYLSAISFISYSTVSISYAQEKYCRGFAFVIVKFNHHTASMIPHHTVKWCLLLANIKVRMLWLTITSF